MADGFNLDVFRSKLVHGGARPSQFRMEIIGTRQDAELRILPFLCEISEIPESRIGHAVVNYFGRKLYFAGDREFTPLTITVLNDEDFRLRHAFEQWSYQITGHNSTVSQHNGSILSGGYVADGIVTQMTRNDGGHPTQEYKFVGMFPVSISNIPLDWGAFDTVEKFTVTLQYQWWENYITPAIAQ